jgi:uncharacterized protein
MMVVSDTTAISGLFKTGHLALLQHFSPQILLPTAVWLELERLEQKGYDLEVLRSAGWITVEEVKNTRLVAQLRAELDAEESEAIVLAIEKHADFLLIDEKDGRAKAARLGVPTIGVVGVLLTLKQNKIIPVVKPILDDLRYKAGFYLSDPFYAKILRSTGE